MGCAKIAAQHQKTHQNNFFLFFGSNNAYFRIAAKYLATNLNKGGFMQTTTNIQHIITLHKWQVITACALSALATLCIVLGTVIVTPPKVLPLAHAETTHETTPYAVPTTKEQLQISVEGLTLALGTITQSQKSDAEKFAIIKNTVDTISTQPGQRTYYTVWSGTQILHSPFTPDVENHDFRLATDENGLTFVQLLQENAMDGGFTSITMPALVASGETVTVDQWVYAKAIPSSSWYIAAFMPYDKTEIISTLALQGKQDMQAGFYYSGLSFAGLAGLLFASGVQRKR